jgi:hypothetical protein
MSIMEKLKYPIGQFICPEPISNTHINQWIKEISRLPGQLRKSVKGLTDSHLNTHYRPGGWTLRQVVHHVADSHMNSYIRFKLALTEDTPTIRGYYEDRWAELPEAKNGDPEISLELIAALHKRWVEMLNSMEETDFDKSFYHPEMNRKVPLKEACGMYAWHGDHHVAHITQTRAQNSW